MLHTKSRTLTSSSLRPLPVPAAAEGSAVDIGFPMNLRPVCIMKNCRHGLIYPPFTSYLAFKNPISSLHHP